MSATFNIIIRSHYMKTKQIIILFLEALIKKKKKLTFNFRFSENDIFFLIILRVKRTALKYNVNIVDGVTESDHLEHWNYVTHTSGWWYIECFGVAIIRLIDRPWVFTFRITLYFFIPVLAPYELSFKLIKKRKKNNRISWVPVKNKLL